MVWQLARADDLDEMVEFLRRDEWRHVNFSSRLHERFRPTYPNPHRISVYLRRDEGEISEAVLVSRGGLVIPVLANTQRDGNRSDLASLVRRERNLHSIMGSKRDVALVQKSLRQELHLMTIDYHLLFDDPARTKHDHRPLDLPGRLKFRRARMIDAIGLFPLQKAYELEEVLIDPRRFNATSTYLNLQQHLKREVVFYASVGREIVAKAGTNARGFTFDQIGGVYTVESLRNRGVAAALLRVLLDHIRSEGRRVSLFVKKENIAALRLYEKLGFIREGEFRITYFRS